MNPLEFMAAVVPSAGFLCVAGYTASKKDHVFADKVDALAPAITKFDNAKRDVYFALASFAQEGSRKADNALFLRAAFLDIDCGEGKAYPTKQAAAHALDAFLQETNVGALGNPWLVSSGNGIHVYWPFTADIPVEQWRVASENLKRLCKAQNLHIDFTVTADPARVLRVPGTFNRKDKANPRPVKILTTGAAFDFAAFAAAVKEPLNGAAVEHLPAASALNLPGSRPKGLDTAPAVHLKLVENSTTSFRNIMQKSVAGTGCAQVAHYLTHAADDGMEPLWRGLLSLAKVCTDGEHAARKLSALHPYSDARLQQKWREVKGPYPCTKFDSENPGVCTSCPHWGKITNPLALGREVQVDNAPREIVVQPDTAPTDPVQPAPIRIIRPSPPRGFSYGANGGVYRDVAVEDEDGNKIAKRVMVLPYDLFVVDILNANGDHYVYMLALRPEGQIKVILPQKAVVSKDDTVKALASQNIIAAFGAGNDKHLFDYVRGCVEEVSSGREAVGVPNSYGWQEDGSFVASGKIFTPSGDVRQVPLPGLENLNRATMPRGDMSKWRMMPEALIAHGFFDIVGIGFGVAFGSPLIHLSGLNGLTINAGSTQSGRGKTLALDLCASVWGNPKQYRTNKGTSLVALQHHAGLLRNMPLVVDEATSKVRGDPEWLPEFIFDMAEGRGKERMEAGSNKERLNTSEWSLIALLSCNSHGKDVLHSRKHSSEGEMRRFLEWNPKKSITTFGVAEEQAIRALHKNYGQAGEIYARWLASHAAVAQALYETVHTALRTDFGFTNDERYWHAGVAAMLTGCILAGSNYANIIDLPVSEIKECFRKLVETTRGEVKSSVRCGEDVLNAYIRENYGRMVNVKVTRGPEGRAVEMSFGSSVVDESTTRSMVAGRVERGVVAGMVVFYIEETVMRQYCAAMSYGYDDFKQEMEQKYHVRYLKKDLLSKTKGPPMQVRALAISRPESDLIEIENEGALPVESDGEGE